jgi:hypothetical protein
MNTQNEQTWLKQMANRPDETPSLEAVHRMEQGLLQKVKRQRTVYKWVRVNSIAGGALAAVVLAVGLLTPGGQSLLHSGSSAEAPVVLQGPEHAKRVEAFTKTLAPDERYAGDNGKGTFLVMKDHRELMSETAGKKKTLLQAPSDATLQIETQRDRELNVAVSAQEEGTAKRLFLVNGITGAKVEVPLSGATLTMAVAPPTGDDMAVLLTNPERTKQTVLSLKWATGQAKTLLEKQDHALYNMAIETEGMIVLHSPREILGYRNGEWQTIATSDLGHLSVGSTVNGVMYALDESKETSVGEYNLNDTKIMLYDDKTNKSRTLLPNVSGSQAVLWSSATDRTTHLVSVFRPLGKTTRFASEEDRARQEGTFELWYVTNGQTKKLYEEKTTFGQSRLTYSEDGDLYLLKPGHAPVEKLFDFDAEKGTVQRVPASSK